MYNIYMYICIYSGTIHTLHVRKDHIMYHNYPDMFFNIVIVFSTISLHH